MFNLTSVRGEILQFIDTKNAPNSFGIKSLVFWPLRSQVIQNLYLGKDVAGKFA
jgi:hypothetical protein